MYVRQETNPFQEVSVKDGNEEIERDRERERETERETGSH